MEEPKPGLNWKRLLITSLLVLLTAGAVGGTTYYVLNSNFQKERGSLTEELNNVKVVQEKATEVTSTAVEKVNTYTDKTGKYTFTVPEGYAATVEANCEGGCSSLVTINKKINDVSYSSLMFTITTNNYGNIISLDNWNKETEFFKDTTMKAQGNLNIGGKSFVKYVGSGFFGTDTHYRTATGNFAYDIHYVEGVDQNLANSVISSIKFN